MAATGDPQLNEQENTRFHIKLATESDAQYSRIYGMQGFGSTTAPRQPNVTNTYQDGRKNKLGPYGAVSASTTVFVKETDPGGQDKIDTSYFDDVEIDIRKRYTGKKLTSTTITLGSSAQSPKLAVASDGELSNDILINALKAVTNEGQELPGCLIILNTEIYPVSHCTYASGNLDKVFIGPSRAGRKAGKTNQLTFPYTGAAAIAEKTTGTVELYADLTVTTVWRGKAANPMRGNSTVATDSTGTNYEEATVEFGLNSEGSKVSEIPT